MTDGRKENFFRALLLIVALVRLTYDRCKMNREKEEVCILKNTSTEQIKNA
jgi:hypothetical protein